MEGGGWTDGGRVVRTEGYRFKTTGIATIFMHFSGREKYNPLEPPL